VSYDASPKAGDVAVAHDAEPLLEVGHMARVAFDSDRAPAPEGLVVSAIEERVMKSALAWQEGRLEFFETPLAEVVAEFNRYNRHKIVIADPELAARRFGGAFASHQIEPFLELLEQSFGVVAEHHSTETVIRQVR
jgi:transmembrane sensor